MQTISTALPNHEQRLESTFRPEARPIGFQCWTDLLFVHWRVPVATLRDLIPKRLSIDMYDGDAWIGLVPFYMSDVRPAGLPAVPWISNFCETNLRTYVHLDGRPGVWFFSLDASRLIPVLIARSKWHLNYHWSVMELNRDQGRVEYSSRRLAKGSPGTTVGATNIVAELGQVVADENKSVSPGSLEFFLAERYLLYCQRNDGQLLCGQVHHRSYPLKEATVETCEQTLTRAAGIETDWMTERRPPDHVLFSEGVRVEIFPLRSIEHDARRR